MKIDSIVKNTDIINISKRFLHDFWSRKTKRKQGLSFGFKEENLIGYQSGKSVHDLAGRGKFNLRCRFES